MKKILSSLLATLALLTMLVGCSVTISNEQLEKDIKSLPCFYAVQVKEMTILEKVKTDVVFRYKLSVLLTSYDFTTTADITLVYTKVEGKWTLSRNEVDLVKVIPNGKLAIHPDYYEPILELSHMLFNYSTYNKKYSTITLVSAKLVSNQTNGTGTIIIEETFNDDVLSMDARYTIKATYTVTSGWNYELVDWIYHDTTKWAGVYDVQWTGEEPGYPTNALNSFYRLEQGIDGLQLSGECRITRRMGQEDNDIIENTLQISYVYDGVTISGQPTFARMTNRLHFEIPSIPDSLLTFNYQPFYPKYSSFDWHDPNNDYYVGAPFLYGNLTRRP